MCSHDDGISGKLPRVRAGLVPETIGGYNFFMVFVPLLISKVIWDGLTVDEQTAFEHAADVADTFFEQTQKDAEQKTREAFLRAGAKVGKLS